MNDWMELLSSLAAVGLCLLIMLAVFFAIGVAAGVTFGAFLATVRYMIGA